jgi:hypothetical protein
MNTWAVLAATIGAGVITAKLMNTARPAPTH